jgi:nucleotide-binding universal stress UspA family protein
MLRLILVPLDGSPFAEHALEHAAELATAAHARLVLVRTADSPHHPHLRQPDHRQDHAELYLEQVRRRMQQTGVSAEISAPHGQVPEVLLAEIAHQKPDLIVMTSHGDSAPGHSALGGVAEAVVATGQAPVLLLPHSSTEDAPSFRSLVGRKVMVLLDGSALAETALPVVLELARVLNSELILFKAVGVYSVPYAVPTELMTVPGVDVQLAWDASFDVKETEAYLSLVTQRLNRQGPGTAVHAQVQVGELIEQVRAFESAANIGLIVMATHGRSRLAEALRGSTVHDIMQATPCPLVIVHPRGESPDWWSTDRVTRPPGM